MRSKRIEENLMEKKLLTCGFFPALKYRFHLSTVAGGVQFNIVNLGIQFPGS